MVTRMTDTEKKWSERVSAWRASGETAEEFAETAGFEPTTLRYWASRLKSRKAAAAPAAVPRPVAMARVVRPGKTAHEMERSRDDLGQLVVAIGEARIVIGREFDPALLRDVVAALGGKK